jgi:hypothetical protein
MIETHVVNTFLAASLREESWFTVLNYLNGLVAPSFLFIAGFVQGMAWSAAPTKPVKFGLRARTLLGIGFIAYALHFPWKELGQHRLHDAIRVGSQVDVLQCITASLGALLLVTWITQKLGPRRGEFAWWLGVSTLLLLTVLPAPAAAHWNPAFVPLRAWLNFSTGSWFPLFPWAAFIFAGALTGAAFPSAATAVVPKPASLWPAGFRSTSSRSSVLVLAPVPLALSAWAFVGACACRPIGMAGGPPRPAQGGSLRREAFVDALRHPSRSDFHDRAGGCPVPALFHRSGARHDSGCSVDQPRGDCADRTIPRPDPIEPMLCSA